LVFQKGGTHGKVGTPLPAKKENGVGKGTALKKGGIYLLNKGGTSSGDAAGRSEADLFPLRQTVANRKES